MTTISSKEIAEWLGKRHDHVVSGIRKVHPTIEEIRCPSMSNTVIINLTVEQAVQFMRTKRNLSALAKVKLQELTGLLELSASAEGIFGDLLESALVGFNIALNKTLTIERQVTDGDYVFDFYIKELSLYIEYNEKGSHHAPDKDKRKATSTSNKVFTVDYKSSHKENVEKTLMFIKAIFLQ